MSEKHKARTHIPPPIYSLPSAINLQLNKELTSTDVQMGWLIREKRGPAWKHGWRGQAVASLSPPPAPVVALFLIVVVLLWMSLSVEYDRQVRRALVGMRLLLLLLPVLLFILVSWVSIDRGRLVVPLLRAEQDSVHRASTTPWGVALLLVLLMVMLYYQPGFHSKWSPWRSY